MKCLNSELISKYVDGEDLIESERKNIETHIHECEHCRKEYNSYLAMRQLLTQYWGGKIEGCFDGHTLAEYLKGLVSDDVRKQIEEHLTECDVCSSELQLMKQIVAEFESELKETIPKEADERIYTAIMKDILPLIELIKKDFAMAAKRLIENFIARYHQSERPFIENFWTMLSPLYDREVRFGRATLDSRASAIVGDSKDYESPSIIFTIMGICDHIQDYDEVVDKSELKTVIRQNARRFGIRRGERKKLEEFFTRELSTSN